MGPNDFACYYQVYKDRAATSRVLEQFRKHHPYNQIFLVSDGGLEFYDIAEQYNCHYTHSFLNIGYWSHTKPEVIKYRATGGKRGHPYGWTCEEAIIFLTRFFKACLQTDREYMMLLADDVFVNQPISIPIDFDISYGGFNPYNFKDLEQKLQIKRQDYRRPTGWGMCCGNFINTATFERAYYSGLIKLIEDYEAIYESGLEGLGYMDTIMSVLLWEAQIDCREIGNPCYSETNHEAIIFHDRS